MASTRKISPLHASEELRASWRADERTVRLLYVGRLASEKNVPLAFRAREAVRARAWRALRRGGRRTNAQRSSSRAHPDGDFVGPQRGAALAEYYASADIFCFPV